MYELKKKLERYLRVNLLGPGPLSYEKRIYRAAVSQKLRNTGLEKILWYVFTFVWFVPLYIFIQMNKYNFIFYKYCHYFFKWLSRNTNKMQLCNRIYYFKDYWRLHMFRPAHRSSSGALNCICSLWFIYPCGDRPLSRLRGPWQRPVTTCVYKPETANTVRAPDDERCAARN